MYYPILKACALPAAAVTILVVATALFFYASIPRLSPRIKGPLAPPTPSRCLQRYTALAVALREPDKVCVLDLSSAGLTTLPPDVLRLSNLQSLYLNNNKLSVLPDTISQLRKLTTLDLTGNPMTAEEVRGIRRLLPRTNVFFLRPMLPPSPAMRTSPLPVP